jgi:hypothetical protein
MKRGLHAQPSFAPTGLFNFMPLVPTAHAVGYCSTADYVGF